MGDSTMVDLDSTMEDTIMEEESMVDMDPLIADTQTVAQDPTVVHMALDPVDLTADPRNAEDPSAWADPVGIILVVAHTGQDPVDLTADITLAVAHSDQDQTQGFLLLGFWQEDLKQKRMIP